MCEEGGRRECVGEHTDTCGAKTDWDRYSVARHEKHTQLESLVQIHVCYQMLPTTQIIISPRKEHVKWICVL
jgi:hypothetical protein